MKELEKNWPENGCFVMGKVRRRQMRCPEPQCCPPAWRARPELTQPLPIARACRALRQGCDGLLT